MNSSAERRRATMWNQPRIRRWPKNRISDSTTAAFSAAMASVSAIASGACDSAGTMISSGTTARSWNSSTPMISRPCLVSICMRSASILTTSAVDDIARMPPRAMPACKVSPASTAAATVARMVSSTCARTGQTKAKPALAFIPPAHIRVG